MYGATSTPAEAAASCSGERGAQIEMHARLAIEKCRHDPQETALDATHHLAGAARDEDELGFFEVVDQEVTFVKSST